MHSTISWRGDEVLDLNSEAESPLVAVIVPAYNARRYIRATVSSVLVQSFSDLEVVVVDDGSTDDTAEIVRGLDDARVRLVSQPNRGTSAARNTGLRMIGPSRFVAFLDSDDLWDRTKLENQLQYLESKPELDLVGTYMRYISSEGRELGQTGTSVDTELFTQIQQGLFFPFPLSSFLVRRKALDRIGGFDEDLGCHSGGPEDIDLIARIAQHGGVDCVPSVLGSYRVHPTSAMATNRRNINKSVRFVQQRLKERMQGRDVTWEDFNASYRPSLNQIRQDALEVQYRNAALWYGERRFDKAILHGLSALALGPAYTVGRLYRQLIRGPVEGTRMNRDR